MHTHDGFFLRLALGFGGASVTRNDVPGLGDMTLSGVSGYFSFDIGAAILESFIVHGRISAMALVDPNVSVDGEELGEAMDTSVSTAVLGIGATYYLMPINMYFTGTFGIARATVETPVEEVQSDAGFAMELDIGKEWWVGDDWGLGVAGRFHFSRVPPSGASSEDSPLIGLAGGVLFSATYN